MPVKAQSSIVYLECNGWETGNYKNKKGNRVSISKPHNIIIALDEHNSRLKAGQKGQKMFPAKAYFSPGKISGKIGKATIEIDRKTGHYALAIFKYTNKQRTD
ncbi:hypothetical protein [Synechococcus sp. UW105]|uniref:hypothetical protein n=1 Tax=Synechococcus sp. UW105 TaxID=337067 RepID=UPI0010BDDD58|nr:hypothetical protein [Synechococcus sp. UW105]